MAYTLQLKRNQTSFESKELALEGLQAQLTSALEGELLMACYKVSEAEKTLLAVKGENSYTILDTEAIPAEVEAALDKIKGAGYNDGGPYATLKAIADALEKINGSGEGSIAKSLADAKSYTDTKIGGLDVSDSAVANSFVTTVSETDGKIAVSRGAVTSNDKTVKITNGGDGGIDLAANVDGITITVSGEGVMSVAQSALTQYQGSNAITITGDDGGTKTVALKLNSTDKILTQNADGLLANLNLTWSTTDGLKLIGKGESVIATIPAKDFIKDGMLEEVELSVLSEGPETNPQGLADGTYLHFTFNTDGGSKEIYVNVTSLIDVYTAGNGLELSGKTFSVKRDASSESFLTVGANGIKLSGVQAAIDAVKSLETAAIDKIEASVGLAEDGSYTDPRGNYTSGSTTVMDAISKLDAQAKKNADAISSEASTRGQKDTELEGKIGDLGDNGSVMEAVGKVQAKADASDAKIQKLVAASGLGTDSDIKFTAPTVSTEFSSTTSIQDMLNKIDKLWGHIDCGTY